MTHKSKRAKKNKAKLARKRPSFGTPSNIPESSSSGAQNIEWKGMASDACISLDAVRSDELNGIEGNSPKNEFAWTSMSSTEWTGTSSHESIGSDAARSNEIAGTEENNQKNKPVRVDELNETEEISPEIEALRVHPQLADQYRILRTVGRGTQGTVYAARDLRTCEIVAIKALSFREIADWKASDLFMREIALLKSMRIEGTPHYIDAINATASPQPYYFLVQDFIPGESLQAKLDRGESFSTQAVIAIALAIIPILEKLRTYSPPIVHRDIKPSNIMMTPGGDIYLIDFGAAMFNERRTGGSTFAGTAGYMAPEQCMGTSTSASDVYGLGATLIHLLTGIAPYKMQMLESNAIVPKKKKNRRFLTLLRKPFAALADAIRKRRRTGSKKRVAAFPCSMTLRFKPHLPKKTPKWFAELLEVMVSPYPDQRVKDLNRLVHAMCIIGNAKLNGHSVHMDAAARLGKMETIQYEGVITNGISFLCIALAIFTPLPALSFLIYVGLLFYRNHLISAANFSFSKLEPE